METFVCPSIQCILHSVCLILIFFNVLSFLVFLAFRFAMWQSSGLWNVNHVDAHFLGHALKRQEQVPSLPLFPIPWSTMLNQQIVCASPLTFPKKGTAKVIEDPSHWYQNALKYLSGYVHDRKPQGYLFSASTLWSHVTS